MDRAGFHLESRSTAREEDCKTVLPRQGSAEASGGPGSKIIGHGVKTCDDMHEENDAIPCKSYAPTVFFFYGWPRTSRVTGTCQEPTELLWIGCLIR